MGDNVPAAFMSGVHKMHSRGRSPALTQKQQDAARQRRAEGATLKELALSYNVGITTIARLNAR